MPVLQTKRLHMRRFSAADGDFLYRLMANPQVFFWLDAPVDYSDAEILLAEKLTIDGPGLGWWPVFLNPESADTDETRDFLGQVCVQPLPGSDEVELGYHLLPHAWGKGYATEAAIVLLQHVFDVTELNHISAVVLPDNHRSLGVARKLGFEQRGQRLHGKKPLLHNYFELTRSGFEAQMTNTNVGAAASGE